ncbi:MAG: hypothetical protein V3S12_01425 [Acidiferrobacterales bacterium]
MAKYILADSDNRTRRGDYIFPSGSSFSSQSSSNIVSENASEIAATPLVAIMLNPWHAQLDNPKMLKMHFTTELDDTNDPIFRTNVCEVPMPEATTDQKIIFALLVIKQVYKNTEFNQWAEKWITGSDRGAASAGKLIACLGRLAKDTHGATESLAAMGVRDTEIENFCGLNNDFSARASEAIFAAQMYVDRADNWPLLASRSVCSAVAGLDSRVDFDAIAEQAINASSNTVMRTRAAA